MVFFIERFTHDLRQLRGNSCWICRENELGLGENELTKILILELSFADVVGDWEVVDPVLGYVAAHLRVRPYILLLEFDHFSNTGNCVVLRVVELFLFCFFLMHFPGHSVFYGSFQSLQAYICVSRECMTTMLSDDSDSICCSLSEAGRLVISE